MSVDPDIVPNLNKEGVFQYLTSEGYLVTRNAIKEAVLRRELRPVRVGRCNLFARDTARAWVHGRVQDGIYRAPESIAAQ
jgi:hypothetical protein